MNNGNLDFARAAGVRVIGTTLFFILKVKADTKADLIEHGYFLKNIVEELKLYDDSDTLSTISLINKTRVQYYYSGDIADYLGEGEKVKFIDLKIDFRDKEFHHIFDGFYNIELDISYAAGKTVNCYTFECFTNEDNYSNIKRSSIERVIILISIKDDTEAIVFKNASSMLKMIFPSGDSGSSISTKPIIKVEKQKPQDVESYLPGKDGESYVYIASNPYINALKIGSTTNVKQRLTALSSSTSVPVRFKLEYKKSFMNATKVERYIFKSFAQQGYRVSPKREFFTIPLNEAISFIKSINEKEIF